MIWNLIVSPLSVLKSGYFLLIWVKVCLKKLAFSDFLKQFCELAFQTKYWLYQTRNLPLSLCLTFLVVVFSQFCSNLKQGILEQNSVKECLKKRQEKYVFVPAVETANNNHCGL